MWTHLDGGLNPNFLELRDVEDVLRPDLREQMERMLRSSQAARERVAEVAERARETQASATSRDNLVTCTVSAGIGIVDLTISPRAMQRYSSQQLAAAVREVIAEANRRLGAAVAEQYRSLLGDSFDPQALADPDAAADAIKNMSMRLHGG